METKGFQLAWSVCWAAQGKHYNSQLLLTSGCVCLTSAVPWGLLDPCCTSAVSWAAARAERAHTGAWRPPGPGPGLGKAPWPHGTTALCLGNPLAWALGLTCIIKALVGAEVIKSWVRAARSPWAARGWSWVSLRAQPLGTPSVSICFDGTEESPGSGPGLLDPGCCSEMLPSCSVHPGSLCNISWGSYKALHFCHHCSQTSLFERHTGWVEKPRYKHMAEIRRSLILRHWAL